MAVALAVVAVVLAAEVVEAVDVADNLPPPLSSTLWCAYACDLQFNGRALKGMAHKVGFVSPRERRITHLPPPSKHLFNLE